MAAKRQTKVLETTGQARYIDPQKRYWDMNNVIDTAMQKVAAEKDRIIEEQAKALEKERAERKEKEKQLSERIAELERMLNKH